MFVALMCFILVSLYYLLFLYRPPKFVEEIANDEFQRNTTNFRKRRSYSFSEFQNRTRTEKTNQTRINSLGMSSIDGVGTVTRVGSHFEWEIKNFSSHCKEVGDFLLSPIFATTWLNNYVIEWKLRLYPNGTDYLSENYLSLYIECLATDKLVGDVMFSILNDENSKRWEWRMNETIFGNRMGNTRFVRRHLVVDRNNRVLLNDTLKILCEVILNPKQNNLLVKHLDGNSFDYRLQTFDDFEKLLETGNGSDVAFRVGGTEIKAHKAFLISRSPVFEAMFEHEMKEKEKNVVEILDIEYHIVKELLRFIYIGKVDNIQAKASELLKASEKYCVNGLKVLCERELSKQIQLKNVFQLLHLAATYNANFLKSQTILFITTNKHDIAESPELKKLADLHADTVCEVFRAVVKSSQ